MSRQYRPGDAAYVTFAICSATGALVNADSPPTAKVVHNGAIDVTVTVTVGAALQTGVYSASYTVPLGYTAGDDVEVFAFATVSGVASGARVDAVRLVGWGPAALPNVAPGAAGGLFIAGTNAATTANFTGSLTGSVGSVAGDVAGNVGGNVAGHVAGFVGSVNGDVNGKVLGGGASAFGGVGVSANTTQFLGHAVVLDSNNYPGVNVVDVAGAAASVVSGPTDANVVSVGGTGFSGATVPANLQAIQSYNVICSGVVTVPLAIGTSTLTAAQVRDVDNTSPPDGSLGAKVNSAAAAGDPWSTNLPGPYSGSTAGALLYQRLDAAVSSRSTFAGGAVASVTGPVGSVLGDVAGSVGSVTGPVGSVTGGALAAQIPANFTAGLFAAPGVFSTGAFANAPSGGGGGGGATLGQIQGELDTRGLTLGVTNRLDVAVSSRSVFAGGAVASVTGAVGSVGAAVNLNLAQTGLLPRALDLIADADLTVGDALVGAVCAAAGKERAAGTAYTVETPYTGTVIRTFALDSPTDPSRRD